jgi:general stress protein YciG
MPKNDGEMTVREAGRKGGQTVKAKHGPDFFKESGQMGGKATAAAHGHEFYQEIGRKGGQKGGARVRELIAKGKAAE